MQVYNIVSHQRAGKRFLWLLMMTVLASMVGLCAFETQWRYREAWLFPPQVLHRATALIWLCILSSAVLSIAGVRYGVMYFGTVHDDTPIRCIACGLSLVLTGINFAIVAALACSVARCWHTGWFVLSP